MSIALDHVGVLVKDIDESIDFYSRILGLNEAAKRVDRGLANAQIQISDTVAFAIWESPEIQCQHFAFSVDGDEFDAIFERIKDAGVSYGNATDGYGRDLNMKGPDLEAGARGDGKSLYFDDPSGHRVEIITYSGA